MNFSKTSGYIHKINLFELMLVKCLSCISTYCSYHAKNGILVIKV